MGAGTPQEEHFFDAGVLIGALLSQDLRHAEALPLVEAARRGDWAACTSTGILAEVYVHLTNERASPPHTPAEAQAALLVPSGGVRWTLSKDIRSSCGAYAIEWNVE